MDLSRGHGPRHGGRIEVRRRTCLVQQEPEPDGLTEVDDGVGVEARIDVTVLLGELDEAGERAGALLEMSVEVGANIGIAGAGLRPRAAQCTCR